MKHDAKKWTEIEVRAVAVEAEADPRTVRKVIAGRTVRGLVGDRIRRALDARGTV